MLYSAGRGIVWMLKLVAVVVVTSYVISGCMDKHRALSGPTHPESAVPYERPLEAAAESRLAQQR